MLPSFIVIGAMKAGTTSLFRYLSDHPQIYLHPQKELNFFSRPQEERQRQGYEAFFKANGRPFAGDVSTDYAKFPLYPEIPRLIHELIPDVRLIYLVRHPVKRALSHYHHNLLWSLPVEPIDVALRRDRHYLQFSQYHMQIQEYLRYFEPGQVLVLLLEELIASPEQTMRRIFGHIGCDATYVPRNLAERANVSAERIKVTRAIHLVRNLPGYQHVRHSVPERWKQHVMRLLGDAPPPLPVPQGDTLQWLNAQLRPDAEALAGFLGRSEALWDLETHSMPTAPAVGHSLSSETFRD